MIIRCLLLVVCLSACSAGDGQFEVSGQAAAGQVAYVGPVLIQARRNFFGEDEGGGGGSGGSASGGGFGLDEPVTLQGAAPSVISVSWMGQKALSDGWQVLTTVRLSHQEAQAHLPDGLGVLTDPMRVSLWADAAAAEVAIGWRQPAGGAWSWGYAAGLGVQQITARGHLRSALIDLSSRVDLTQPYTIVSGRLDHATGAGLTGQVMLFESGATEVRLGLFQAF